MGKMKDLDLAFEEISEVWGELTPMMVCKTYGEFIEALGIERRTLDRYHEVKTGDAKEAFETFCKHSKSLDTLYDKLADVIIVSNVLIKSSELDREKIIELMNKKLEKF